MAENSNDNPVTKGHGDSLGNLDSMGEPGVSRSGPVLDVDRFKAEYLFGIPLTSSLTGETIADASLKNFIKKGIAEVETAVRITISPVRMKDRFDFERADDLQFGTRQLTRWPVIKVEHLKALWPGRSEALAGADPNQSEEADYPTSWVVLTGDTGLVRIVPNSSGIVGADAIFLTSGYRSAMIGGMKSWPNMWRIHYIAGFEPDKVPDLVNDAIGTCAALRFLSMMGPVIFPYASQSIGLDGMSQAVATAGPQWLQMRMQELEQERDRLVNLLKTHFNTDITFAAF